MNLKRPLRGSETGANVRMVQRALNKWVRPRLGIPEHGIYDQRTSDRVMAFQADEKIRPASGDFGQRTLDELWRYFDAYGRLRYRTFKPPPAAPPVPRLGPIVAGGKDIVDMRLTHETDGIAGYPAFDDGWLAGRHVVAPERFVVTQQSSAQGADAFYGRGDSGVRYWVGHVFSAPPDGREFSRGQTMATLANLPAYQGGPHVHLGVNADRLGVSLRATGYGPGPTLGEQLKAGLGGDR